MVVVCKDTFPEENQYAKEFAKFPGLTLSPFQKWAVKAIADGDHSLVTAHTGSGKTLPAEYAILRAASRGKRVIYTAPIKALSNTKLSDLRRKYPEISFGLITGDITDNPDAQVLIMTTEILPNTICARKARASSSSSDQVVTAPLSFEMDFDKELDVVVFDEVHYINDEDRGGAWEQAILMIPPTVQLVMLSATIDRAESFAGWVENAKKKQAEAAGVPPKQLYLSSSTQRSVPLTHHLWFSCASRALHNANTKDAVSGLRENPLVLQGPGTVFQERQYLKVAKAIRLVKDNRMSLRRAGVIDSLLKHLVKEKKLPAICFVFSRRQTECCAREVSCDLRAGDEDAQETAACVEKECRKILASRLPNFLEYMQLPEYIQLINMLRKGVAVHHAGILPVFREMIEILFEKKMIKILFATETLAVGVNFSTASVIFSALSKFDGTIRRALLPHEYTQMAGRAGRRGIDTEGHVWICADLCDVDTMRPSICRNIMCGRPPLLTSKFKVGLGMVLGLVKAGTSEEEHVLSSTLMGSDMAAQAAATRSEAQSMTEKAEIAQKGLELLRTPSDVIQSYRELQSEMKGARKRKRGRLLQQMEELRIEYRTLESDLSIIEETTKASHDAEAKLASAGLPETILPELIQQTKELLHTEGFCEVSESGLTEKGIVASYVREAHPLALAALLSECDYGKDVTPSQLAASLSCQCGISVPPQSVEAIRPESGDPIVDAIANRYASQLQHFEDMESRRRLQSGEDYEYQFALLKPILAWGKAHTPEDCNKAIAMATLSAGIGIGGFVKAILKICSMAAELEKAAEAIHRLDLKEKAAGIPKLMLKYVATAQSLYI